MIGLIILCLFFIIIIVIKNKNDKYKIAPDAITEPVQTVNLSTTYSYPCNNCVSITDNKVRPFSTYNLSHDRCIRNNTNSYLTNNLPAIANYTMTPESSGYESCTGAFNSMYSIVSGRFIKIANYSNPSIPIILSSISVFDRTNNNISNNAFIIIVPPNIAENNNQYPNIIMNNTISSISYKTSSLNPYILIDLNNTFNIAKVVITHSTLSDARTLTGGTLMVLQDNNIKNVSVGKSYLYPIDIGPMGFIGTFTGDTLIRTMYTQNNVGPLPDGVNNPNELSSGLPWPCAGCLLSNGNFYTNNIKYNYTESKGPGCFLIDNPTLNASIIPTMINNTITSTNCNLFRNCGPFYHTMSYICAVPDIWIDATDINYMFSDAEGTQKISPPTNNIVRCLKNKGSKSNFKLTVSSGFGNITYLSNVAEANNNGVLHFSNVSGFWTPYDVFAEYANTGFTMFFLGKSIVETISSPTFFIDILRGQSSLSYNGRMYLYFGISSDTPGSLNRFNTPWGRNTLTFFYIVASPVEETSFYLKTKGGSWVSEVKTYDPSWATANSTEKTLGCGSMGSTSVTFNAFLQVFEFIVYKGVLNPTAISHLVENLNNKWNFN